MMTSFISQINHLCEQNLNKKKDRKKTALLICYHRLLLEFLLHAVHVLSTPTARKYFTFVSFRATFDIHL